MQHLGVVTDRPAPVNESGPAHDLSLYTSTASNVRSRAEPFARFLHEPSSTTGLGSLVPVEAGAACSAASGTADRLTRLGRHLIECREHARYRRTGAFHEAPARVRQGDAARGAREQHHVKLLFELADSLADRGPGYAELARRR